MTRATKCEVGARSSPVAFDLDYARNVIEAEARGINSIVSVVDAPFAKAAEMIYHCSGSCIVSGIGKAGIIGQKVSATLASSGIPSHFLHPAEALHGDLGRLRTYDVVVVLSYSGETNEVIQLINLVKQLEIKLIAITGSKHSTLSKHSDVVLCIGRISEACPLGVAPSVSTACMLAIGDALAFTVMKARHFGIKDYARFHPSGSLGARLITVEQSMIFRPDEKLPIAGVNDTVRKMLEKRSEVKRHGAVMIVDEYGRLAGIFTDGDLRRLLTIEGANAFEFKAGEVMTANSKKIRSDALASEATAILHKYRIDELPVVDTDDKPVGLIDVQDIVTIKVVG